MFTETPMESSQHISGTFVTPYKSPPTTNPVSHAYYDCTLEINSMTRLVDLVTTRGSCPYGLLASDTIFSDLAFTDPSLQASATSFSGFPKVIPIFRPLGFLRPDPTYRVFAPVIRLAFLHRYHGCGIDLPSYVGTTEITVSDRL